MQKFLIFPVLLFLQLSTDAQDNTAPVYPAAQLKSDFLFLQETLIKNHPGLYWYSSKEEMQSYFRNALSSIPDSMNELQFKNLISGVLAKIRCGHTVIKNSDNYKRRNESQKAQYFPSLMRVWDDTAVVRESGMRNNIIPRGAIIKSINSTPISSLLQNLYAHMSCDGYANGVNEIRLSFSFPAYYRNLYGSYDRFLVQYSEEDGVDIEKMVPAFIDSIKKADSNLVAPIAVPRKEKRTQRLQNMRNFTVDTLQNTGILEINSFTDGYRLKKFYRKTFRQIKEQQLSNLVIDVRTNGGGLLSNYIKLTKYLKDRPFRVADSVVALTRKLPPTKLVKAGKFNHLFMVLSTKKKKDGLYHFTWFEKHRYRIKRKHHFDGNIYVLTSGQTFSAATLFTGELKGQSNCTVVGEETGGGAYGNNGMLIPDVLLPHTKMKFTLPLFRMVINSDASLKGRGIMPDIEVKPTVDGIRDDKDLKMERVKMLIRARL